MRLKVPTIITDITRKEMFPFFESSVTLNHLSTQDLNRFGYCNMEYVDTLYNSDNEILAHVFKKNDMLGAYDVHGNLYMDFQYTSYELINVVVHQPDLKHSDFFAFEKETNQYDIYYKYELIMEDVLSVPYMVKDAKTEDVRYLIMRTALATHIYDILKKDFYHLSSINNIMSIDSEYDEIIYFETVNNLRINCISDFAGTYKKTFIGDCNLFFANSKNFYIARDNKSMYMSLITFRNGLSVNVTDTSYKEILEAYSNWMVVKRPNAVMEIIYFEPDTHGKYHYDITRIYNTESIEIYDMDNVIKLTNGKKILMTHYLENEQDYEKYECDEIIYEGNDIFKCIQLNQTGANIAYICCGQAINATSKNNEYHISKCSDEDYKIFNHKGDILIEGTGQSCIMDIGKLVSPVMTEEIEGTEKLVTIDILDNSSKYNQMLVNLVSGEIYNSKHYIEMVWHNLFSVDGKVYDIYGRHPSCTDFELLQAYNNYLIIRKEDNCYIVGKNLQYIKVENGEYHFERLYRYSIVENDKEAYLVSNNDVELFSKFATLHGTIIYKYKKHSDNYIIDWKVVTKDDVKQEKSLGIIGHEYDILL